MESIFREIVDASRLRACVQSSLGNVERLRELEPFIVDDDSLCSILEQEILRLLDDCEDDVYLQWLCGTLKNLKSQEWARSRKKLIDAICVSFDE